MDLVTFLQDEFMWKELVKEVVILFLVMDELFWVLIILLLVKKVHLVVLIKSFINCHTLEQKILKSELQYYSNYLDNDHQLHEKHWLMVLTDY